jgi:hypothetical protein
VAVGGAVGEGVVVVVVVGVGTPEQAIIASEQVLGRGHLSEPRPFSFLKGSGTSSSPYSPECLEEKLSEKGTSNAPSVDVAGITEGETARKAAFR